RAALPTDPDGPMASQHRPANLTSWTAHGLSAPALPARIDQYRLLRRLGSGGTGVVCEAEDLALGRRVAIKLSPHKRTTAVAAPPPWREFASRVRHPHVVSVWAFGAYEGGAYSVMELLEGGSVQSLLGSGPLPWRQATAILVSACAGVGAVHAC